MCRDVRTYSHSSTVSVTAFPWRCKSWYQQETRALPPHSVVCELEKSRLLFRCGWQSFAVCVCEGLKDTVCPPGRCLTPAGHWSQQAKQRTSFTRLKLADSDEIQTWGMTQRTQGVTERSFTQDRLSASQSPTHLLKAEMDKAVCPLLHPPQCCWGG